MAPLISINRPAPDFLLPDLDGNHHSLANWRGQIVVLNFWSAECPWSERCDRELLAYLPNWGDEVLLCSIASNANESPELLARLAVERSLPLVLIDSNQYAADLYQALTTPHLFVIDHRGLLRYHGAFDDVTFRRRSPSQFYLRQAVEALLAGRPPTPDYTEPTGCTIVRHI